MTVQHADPAEPLAHSVDETERLLGLSRDTVFRLINNGELARVKVGRRTLITTRSMHKLLEERRRPAAMTPETNGTPGGTSRGADTDAVGTAGTRTVSPPGPSGVIGSSDGGGGAGPRTQEGRDDDAEPTRRRPLIGPLDGAEIPGGCVTCVAYQRVRKEGVAVFRITVSHDVWCPTWRKMARRNARGGGP